MQQLKFGIFVVKNVYNHLVDMKVISMQFNFFQAVMQSVRDRMTPVADYLIYVPIEN